MVCLTARLPSCRSPLCCGAGWPLLCRACSLWRPRQRGGDQPASPFRGLVWRWQLQGDGQLAPPQHRLAAHRQRGDAGGQAVAAALLRTDHSAHSVDLQRHVALSTHRLLEAEISQRDAQRPPLLTLLLLFLLPRAPTAPAAPAAGSCYCQHRRQLLRRAVRHGRQAQQRIGISRGCHSPNVQVHAAAGPAATISASERRCRLPQCGRIQAEH